MENDSGAEYEIRAPVASCHRLDTTSSRHGRLAGLPSVQANCWNILIDSIPKDVRK